jgi:Predicted oxidoreductases (related to aryl-alcohol dehydrogenases)
MSNQMKYGEVPGVGKPISRIVQGIIQVPHEDEAAGFALMDAVYEQGINAFDTAHIYAGGGKDRFLGKWINSRGLRDKVVVLAKGAHHGGDRKRVTEYDIAADLHDTLARMQTDYVDLYVLHRDDPNYPVEKIVDALNQWMREGKIKAFGGSNWSVERIRAANDYAKKSGQQPFAVSSPNFSLARQLKEPWDGCITISGPEQEEARRYYAETNMPLFTWSSLAGGFLSGRMDRDNLDTFTGGLDKLAVECYASDDNFQRLDRVKELGAKKGLSVAQMAVAYILSYPLNIFALIGSATPEEVQANVAALNTPLTEQEMAYLDLRADSPA